MNAPLISQNTCSTCAHRLREGKALFCRRYPPQQYVLWGQGPGGTAAIAASNVTFTPVHDHWTCGEFTRILAHVPASAL